MNTLPPNEPLDDQEREFARILHALPSGEPSPALDAKILRAATNAAASSKRPVRRMLASAGALWGIGSAAAAVLALGVAWQMKYGGADHTYVARAPQAQAVSDTAEEDSVAVELSSQPADAPFVPPPPPPPMESTKPMPPPASPKLRSPPQAQPGRAAAAAAPAAAEPEAFSRDHLDEHVSQAGDDRSLEASALAAKEAAAQQARSEAQMELKAKTEDNEREQAARMASNAAPAPPPPPVAAAAPAAAASDTAGGARADSGFLSRAATGGQVDKSEAEANRKPATWLADIRKLRDQGRLDEARASLVEFRKKYPKWVIPTDLAPLLSE